MITSAQLFNIHFYSVNDLVNGVVFNEFNVLLKSAIQNVSGKKTFELSEDNTLHIEKLEFNGMVNNINISHLMHTQVYDIK